MPVALKVDKEAVRVLVQALGVRPAARELGIAEGTVQYWSAEGKWLAETRDIPASRPPPASMVPSTAPTKSPSEALADVMQDHNRTTRLSLAKATRRLAQEAESAPLEQSGDVLQVAKTAALVHGWNNVGEGQQLLVNISLLGVELPEHKSQVIDVEGDTP